MLRVALLVMAFLCAIFTINIIFSSNFEDVEDVYKYMEEGLELVNSNNHKPFFYDTKASSFFEWTNVARIKQSSYLRPGDYNGSGLYEIVNSDNGFSDFASKLIPLGRSPPEHRPSNCKFWHYNPYSMPTASVIMAFTNEDITILARSIYSILLHTPRHLLAEIILVIDCDNCFGSNDLLSRLFNELNEVKFTYGNKFVYDRLSAFRAEMPLFAGEQWNTSQVVLTATGNRSGLGASLNLGATRATGEVLVFLKSCIEVTHNWLPPLLAPIMDDPKTVSLFTIGNILPKSFEFTQPPDFDLTFWNWGFHTRSGTTDLSKKIYLSDGYNQTLPYHTGLLNSVQFAISRTFFRKVGRFSLNYLITSEINFDLTLRILFFNGRIVRVPCSIIYVLKKTTSDPIMEDFEEFLFRNIIYEPKCLLKQFASVLFTEKNLTNFFLYHPTLVNFSCLGYNPNYDITDNLPDLIDFNFLSTHTENYTSYHFLSSQLLTVIFLNTFVSKQPLELQYFGNLMNPNYMVCLSSDLRKFEKSLRVISSYCSKISLKPFRLDSNFRLHLEEYCIYPNQDWNMLEARDCFWDQWEVNSMPWFYDSNALQLRLQHHCLTFSETKGITLTPCANVTIASQTWIWA